MSGFARAGNQPTLQPATRADLEHRGLWHRDGEFRCGGMSLALERIRQHFEPIHCWLWAAEEIAGALRETAKIGEPPVADLGGVGPGQVLVRVECHVLVGRVVVGAGFEITRGLAVEVAIGEVEASDHAERLAGEAGGFGYCHPLS